MIVLVCLTRPWELSVVFLYATGEGEVRRTDDKSDECLGA